MPKPHTEDSEVGSRIRDAFRDKFKVEENKDIGKLMGKEPPSVSGYLTKKGKVPCGILLQVSELTGYSVHWLLNGKGPKMVLRNSAPKILFELEDLFSHITDDENHPEYSEAIVFLKAARNTLENAGDTVKAAKKHVRNQQAQQDDSVSDEDMGSESTGTG